MVFFRHNGDNYLLTCPVFQLDSGSPERICLTSRDEQSVLVVSYAELKQNYERAFSELLTPSSQAHAAFT